MLLKPKMLPKHLDKLLYDNLNFTLPQELLELLDQTVLVNQLFSK
jgi:hypothetical protein